MAKRNNGMEKLTRGKTGSRQIDCESHFSIDI